MIHLAPEKGTPAPIGRLYSLSGCFQEEKHTSPSQELNQIPMSGIEPGHYVDLVNLVPLCGTSGIQRS